MIYVKVSNDKLMKLWTSYSNNRGEFSMLDELPLTE